MVDFEGEGIRFGSGDGAEPVGERIAADGEGDTLREKMPYFCGREPMRLRRLPVDEVEIRVLGVSRRRAFGLLVLQIAKDERLRSFVLRNPQPLASAIAVVELFLGGIETPEFNKRMTHSSIHFVRPTIGFADRPTTRSLDYRLCRWTDFLLIFFLVTFSLLFLSNRSRLADGF